MRTQKQAGFTLLEIMVVIVILGLLVAIVAPNVLGNQDKGNGAESAYRYCRHGGRTENV